MASFIISYDIPSNRDYQSLIDTIKHYGTWAHITQSTWAIVTDSTASEIRNALNAYIPEGGRLLVVQSANIAAWNNVMCSNDWLKKNI